MKIKQLTSYPNPNELGMGNTHETYIRVENSLNVTDIFPIDKDVLITDSCSVKSYYVKAKSGTEFRINQLGQLYREYDVHPGDELKFTYIEKDGEKSVFFTVKKYNRVYLNVTTKGTEIVDDDRLVTFLKAGNSPKEYEIPITEGILTLKFSKSEKKRADSPTDTDFYESLVNSVKISNGCYYISLDSKNTLDEVKKNFVEEYNLPDSLSSINSSRILLRYPLQQIFYGAPGTGKSHSIEEKTKGKRKIRTTFHPDSDYSTFVGCYKPYKANGSAPITYEFVPQAFVKAYVEAWKKYTEPEPDVFLVIEEINRGNCAQIFGDLFQLLDRDNNGFSKYRIDADSDLQRYLQKAFDGITFEDQFADIKSGEKLCLPNNLHIWATMNTSDQSLFPMDSAFKRRWEWEYVPVNHEDAQRFHIFIGGKSYNWNDFIVTVNKKVFDATQSADKQLGNRFCKSNGVINSGESDEKKQEYMIFSDQFVSKVMFYLWEEVCKDAPEDEQINFMRIKKNLSSTSSVYFTFQELYENKPYEGGLLNREAILQMFMNYLGVAEESSANFKSILAGKSIVDIEETATGIRPKECNLKDLFGEKTTSESEMTSVEEDVDAGSENNDE